MRTAKERLSTRLCSRPFFRWYWHWAFSGISSMREHRFNMHCKALHITCKPWQPAVWAISSCIERLFGRRLICGQATVEAAFLIPLIFLGMLMLLQPGILLYDRIVMQAAASDGCRMLVTRSDSQGLPDSVYRESVIRHLGAIPMQDNFHVHRDGCTWNVQLSGNEYSSEVSVTISQEVRPLPILDVGCTLLGITNGSGNFELSVSQSMPTQPQWVGKSSLGINPGAWTGYWS
jgi:hypothetical protein